MAKQIEVEQFVGGCAATAAVTAANARRHRRRSRRECSKGGEYIQGAVSP